MRRGVVLGGVTLAAGIVAALLWHFFAPVSYTHYPPRTGEIAAFGDSIVFGTGSTEGHDFISLLSAGINEPIENFGTPGDTTQMALLRIDAIVEKHPRIVLVLLGGNDYLRRVPKTETFKNLSDIVDRLQKDGVLVVLLGVRGGILSDNFAGEFKRLASEKKIPYRPDVLGGLLGDKRYMSDEVHPNNAGYAIIADRVLQTLRPLLR